MKKRIKTFLIISCLAICLMHCLASCSDKCKHVYDNDCDATCNGCGETREVSAHNWEDATCTAPKTCKSCGLTEGEKLTHTFNDATCILPKTCKDCGETEGEALGHTPEADDGDCLTEVKCGVCGAVTTPAKSEHIAGDDDGDCTTPVTCVACDKVFVEAKTHRQDSELKYDATHHWYECQNDGCAVHLENVNHDENDNGACSHCGLIDAANMSPELLNSLVTDRLTAGKTDIVVHMSAEPKAAMFTAIRRAICDTDGVADGSIDLTLVGVTVIPTHYNFGSDGSVIFGLLENDENGVRLESPE